jgi:hypothetical protein
MRVADFSVVIPEGNENAEGYVQLDHNTQYTIRLGNGGSNRADAEIKVDGKVVGVIRVDAFSTVVIERPTHDKGKFTFYKEGTKEAKKVKSYKIKTDNKGLVSVTFKPEKFVENTPVAPIMYAANSDGDACIGSSFVDPTSYRHLTKALHSGGPRGMSAGNFAPGITGLSGQSSQSFYTVADLDYDTNAFVTVNLRLVATESKYEPRELTAAIGRSNPVPRPV